MEKRDEGILHRSKDETKDGVKFASFMAEASETEQLIALTFW